MSYSDSFEDSSGFGVETWIIGHQARSREDSREGMAVVQAEGGCGLDEGRSGTDSKG